MTVVSTFAPGKLIMSGEHAVVHGAPAIAMAVNYGAAATLKIEAAAKAQITLSLPAFSYHKSMTIEALSELYALLQSRYDEFKAGHRPVNAILDEPADLLWYALGEAIFACHVTETGALSIEIKTDIPVGCGMGSSAAITAALLCGLFTICGKAWDPAGLYKLVHDVEKLQHGNSSGIDPCVVTQGGFIWFKNGSFKSLMTKAPPFYFINTGQPSSSTGECVQRSSQALQNKKCLDQFADCTEQFALDLIQGNSLHFSEHIKLNHRLLCEIGVVPVAIQKLIHAIEVAGGAAKICGAGSVSGEHAGILLVMGAEEVVKEAGYEPLAVSLCERGASIN